MDKMEFLAQNESEQVETILQVMADVVTEFGPNHTYRLPREYGYCRYVLEGAPSCLIAQVLSRLGWSLDDLKTREGKSAIDWFEGAPLARTVLAVAQGRQDFGNRWGDALAYARAAAAGVITEYISAVSSIRDDVRPFLPDGYVDPS